jgi:hypothetical protein
MLVNARNSATVFLLAHCSTREALCHHALPYIWGCCSPFVPDTRSRWTSSPKQRSSPSTPLQSGRSTTRCGRCRHLHRPCSRRFRFCFTPLTSVHRSPVISSWCSTFQHAARCTVHELLMCAAAMRQSASSSKCRISQQWETCNICGMGRTATRQLSGDPKGHQAAITRTLPSPQQTQNTRDAPVHTTSPTATIQ